MSLERSPFADELKNAGADESILPEEAGGPTREARLTVLVPAYNEAGSIPDTITSLQAQTRMPAEVIVIDDCSTDDTGAVARELGATVLRPASNTGSKAGAQTFALDHVTTELVMAIDADTVLEVNAVDKLLAAFEDPGVSAASGFVLPRHVRTLWERGRYVEYMFAFTFFKVIQDFYRRPLISSGCFSVYRTEALRTIGGWSNRTMAEDMDLTWTMYKTGHSVRFVPEAVCYPIEPHNYHFMSKQLRRWSHGFVQNVRLHWRDLLEQPYLRTAIAVALWDATVASTMYLAVVPVLAVLVNPLVLLLYVDDAPAVAVPVLVKAMARGETRRAVASLPCFFVLRIVNSLFMIKALWMEQVMRRSLTVYEKGH